MSGYTDSTGRFRRLGEINGPVISLADLKLFRPGPEDHGKKIQLDTGNFYYYHKTSVLTADDIFVIQPSISKTGRWLLAPGHEFNIKVAIAFGTADAAALATTPNTTGFLANLRRSFWEVTADWTGGSSSAIGVSLSAAPASTKGDVLGGSGGDVAATLVASGGNLLGTVGADVAGGILWKGNVAARFDRITSAFTAGTGFVHLVGSCLANPGS